MVGTTRMGGWREYADIHDKIRHGIGITFGRKGTTRTKRQKHKYKIREDFRHMKDEDEVCTSKSPHQLLKNEEQDSTVCV